MGSNYDNENYLGSWGFIYGVRRLEADWRSIGVFGDMKKNQERKSNPKEMEATSEKMMLYKHIRDDQCHVLDMLEGFIQIK